MQRALLAAVLSLGTAAAAIRQEPRLYIGKDAVPLRDAVVELGLAAGFSVDLGGREVEGVLDFVSDDGIALSEAWRLINDQLAGTGAAVVRRPTQSTLSLVQLADAARLARIEPDGLESAHPGYVRVLYRVQSVNPDGLATALAELLPKERCVVTPLGDAGHLVIAGLRADVEQATVALRLLDAAEPAPISAEISIANRSTTTIGARLEQITQKRASVGQRLDGWFIPLPESSSVLVVAPEAELAEWRSLIEQLDDPGDVETRHYVPVRFGMLETAELIRASIANAASEIPSWRLVEDELTGTLIITAPLSVHDEVEALLDRLETAERNIGKQLQSFEVRYRDADELLELLEGVLDLESELEQAEISPDDQAPPDEVSAMPAGVRPRPREGRGVRLTVDAATNRVLAYAEPRILRQIGALIDQLDSLEPQVLIEATVVSLTESEVQSLGVELRAAGTINSAMGEVGSFFGLGAPALDGSELMPQALGGGVGVILNPGDFSAVVQALRTVSDGRSLTRPRVVTRNHSRAELNSVVESPYSTVVATNVVATTTFGGSSEAGTTISVTPHLTSGDRIRLEYGITLSAFIGDAADPSLPPPRQQTVLNSEAVLPDGFTVVLGGLELTSIGTSESSVPLLGRLPLIGWAFRDSNESQETTRFFIFLRCDVIRGASYRALRDVTAEDLDAAGLPPDVPVLEPRWMR